MVEQQVLLTSSALSDKQYKELRQEWVSGNFHLEEDSPCRHITLILDNRSVDFELKTIRI